MINNKNYTNARNTHDHMARTSMSEPGATSDWQKEKREKEWLSVIIRAPTQFSSSTENVCPAWYHYKLNKATNLRTFSQSIASGNSEVLGALARSFDKTIVPI